MVYPIVLVHLLLVVEVRVIIVVFALHGLAFGPVECLKRDSLLYLSVGKVSLTGRLVVLLSAQLI